MTLQIEQLFGADVAEDGYQYLKVSVRQFGIDVSDEQLNTFGLGSEVELRIVGRVVKLGRVDAESGSPWQLAVRAEDATMRAV